MGQNKIIKLWVKDLDPTKQWNWKPCSEKQNKEKVWLATSSGSSYTQHCTNLTAAPASSKHGREWEPEKSWKWGLFVLLMLDQWPNRVGCLLCIPRVWFHTSLPSLVWQDRCKTETQREDLSTNLVPRTLVRWHGHQLQHKPTRSVPHCFFHWDLLLLLSLTLLWVKC